MIGLSAKAETAHQTPQEWYEAYGWHLSTESAGDVVLQAVDYDHADEDDYDYPNEAHAELRGAHPGMTRDERDEVIARAAAIRAVADTVCGYLHDAVVAYEAGDVETCDRALYYASELESEHGDDPASSVLRKRLLCEEG